MTVISEVPARSRARGRRWVVGALVLWVVATVVAAVLVTRYGLPFADRRPVNADDSDLGQLIGLQIGAAFAVLLVGLTVLLTRRRAPVDVASRAPARATATREVTWLLAFLAAGQVAGALLGWALGWSPLSWHLPGALYGAFETLSGGEVLTWAVFNGVLFAGLPYLWARSRGYTHHDLLLTWPRWRRDLPLVVLPLFVVEVAGEIAAFGLRGGGLSATEWVFWAPVTLVVHAAGTILPVAIVIYGLLLPRYAALTGSPTAAAVLGGLTYAGVHTVDGWTLWDTWQAGALSLIFVFLQYFPPGIVKSVMTLRTGTVWVHVLAYHSVAPHVLHDTSLVADAFRDGAVSSGHSH